MATEKRKNKLEKVLRRRITDLTIVLENINDPHNVSAIFRSADAVGISEVHLLYPNGKFPKLGRKSSASANKWVDKKKHISIKKCFTSLKKKGYKFYATKIDENSKSLFDISFNGKVAIILGNEHQGISEEMLPYIDETIYIPMRGMVQSLNVSVSCAVILYEILRQKYTNQNIGQSMLTEKEIKKKLSLWLKK